MLVVLFYEEVRDGDRGGMFEILGITLTKVGYATRCVERVACTRSAEYPEN